MDIFDDWEDVLKKWPDAQANKVALILKQRMDGSWKRRFIIDFLWSGFNGGTTVPERVVLQRILDFVRSIMDLLEYCPADDPLGAVESIELVTMDFTDAFYTLWLHEPARGKLAIRTLQGWAAFSRLCFGTSGALLIWGRVAASACRLAQATFAASE